ncbi:hypothetical protein RO3G_00512 [Rhizopus delemar RA 99-880]|uniref:Uncharacterized protein n=1 Tax=Rhizopus delemar (strain RA 99-880 / ATCC MYA-4621 / FGSC 9543 / NRRL 43880) TaxID=246409 RepID=I1BHX8_RHIO9|nr:hypothetical protein RO3G_00512 [Rhizopus delemar RA 99-880]|eukprot:EIE75808.1 hypothetical protein RO3G_00512 [Rhizopus delemar RA 99-880]
MASVDNGFRDVSNKKDYTSMSYQERQEELVKFIEDMIVDYEKYSKEINSGQTSTNKQRRLQPNEFVASPLDSNQTQQNHSNTLSSSAISLKGKEKATEQQVEEYQNNVRFEH